MSRSPFAFATALKLLDPSRSASAVFDRVLGVAMFAGAAAAWIPGGTEVGDVLGLVDPKNEATKLLGPLVDGIAEKVSGVPGDEKHRLINAAHTITVLSSYFDALHAELRPIWAALEIGDDDRRRVAGLPSETGHFLHDLLYADVSLPARDVGLHRNLDENLRPYFDRLTGRCLTLLDGLEAWHGPAAPKNLPAFAARVTDQAATLYLDRILRLSPSTHFALWMLLHETTAIQAALGELQPLLRYALGGTRPGEATMRQQLHRVATAVLAKRLLRTEPHQIASPTVEDGFVEPGFRWVVKAPDESQSPSSRSWWSKQPVAGERLVTFLAGHLAGPDSLRRPLLLLGDPGAGKSLLTEVLAAQLPTESFAVLRVPLRLADQNARPEVQITEELRRVLQDSEASLSGLRRECGQCRLVVLLDGFDEMLQASGRLRSSYLAEIADFQEQASDLGKPVAVIVTSRTLVADRADIPDGTPILRLDEFDDERIGRWIDTWNRCQAETSDFVPLSAAGLLASTSVERLLRQPLLLLMIALYLADVGHGDFGSEELSGSELYRRLLDRFIRRQVEKIDGLDARARDRAALLQRRELQFAAFGMINRGQIFLTEDMLDADLAALKGSHDDAHRVLRDFLFVHNAKADRGRQNMYEFLHATFGEFLVAEWTVAEMRRLQRLRDADGDPLEEGSAPDDSRLRPLLSHEPLSVRQRALEFAREIHTSRPPAEQAAVLATISALIPAAWTAPDTGGAYRPVADDPVRRRAAYTANLVLLRVALADEPVPIDDLGLDADGWRRMVRLWRAGLTVTAAGSVLVRLSLVGEHRPRLQFRLNETRSLDIQEAELIGDVRRYGQLVIGAQFIDFAGLTRADVRVYANLARIAAESTGFPALGEMSTTDTGWYERLDKTLKAHPHNHVRGMVARFLSRDAAGLPVDLIRSLMDSLLQERGRMPPVVLASIVAVHPWLLTEFPQISGRLMAITSSQSLPMLPLLWAAEKRTSGELSQNFRFMISMLEKRNSDLNRDFNLYFFSPHFLTYLRMERPAHWLAQSDLPTKLSHNDADLRLIKPADALFVATEENWAEHGPDFAYRYLEVRGVEVGDADPVEALRAYATA